MDILLQFAYKCKDNIFLLMFKANNFHPKNKKMINSIHQASINKVLLFYLVKL
jgi:hypothetical protein